MSTIYKSIRRTGTTPFSLLLSPHPSGPTSFVKLTRLTTETTSATPPGTLRYHPLSRFAAIRQRTNRRMNATQRCYKRNYNTTVRQQPQSHADQLVYVERPNLSAPSSDKMAAESYSKLLPRALGPYRVINSMSLQCQHQRRRNSQYPLVRPCTAGPRLCKNARGHCRQSITFTGNPWEVPHRR